MARIICVFFENFKGERTAMKTVDMKFQMNEDRALK